MITTLIKSYDRLVETLVEYTTPVILLAMRLLVAEAFFRAGQTKIANWDSTLYLFEAEYSVPLLPYELAAYLATATELIIPVLLVFGFLARPAAAVLFVFNIVAVISYPVLWEQGFYDHRYWGAMLLTLCLLGAGKISIDHWLRSRLSG